MTRPFRFGVQYYDPPTSAAWFDMARKAEDLGYSAFHVADHYIGDGEALRAASHPEQTVAAIPAMAAAAAVTSSIAIGVRVACVDYHQPVVLAKELATIEFLSDGRLEAGFGAGWVKSEYEAMGVAWDRAGVRLDRMSEVVKMARSAFAGEELDVRGDHVHAVDHRAVPASPRESGPPIMIGGGAPRVLGIAGALADIVSINFDNSDGKIGAVGLNSGTADGTDDKVQWIKDGAGDRFDDLEIEIAAYFTTVTDQKAIVTEQMAKGFGMTPEQIDGHPHTLIGSVDEIVDTIQVRRDRYGISYITVGASAIDAFAPVVEALNGK